MALQRHLLLQIHVCGSSRRCVHWWHLHRPHLWQIILSAVECRPCSLSTVKSLLMTLSLFVSVVLGTLSAEGVGCRKIGWEDGVVLSLGNRVSLSGLGTMVCKMSLGLTTGCGCVVVTLRGGIAGTCEAVGLSTYSFCGRGPVRIWSNIIAVLVDGVVSGRALVSAICTGAGGGGRAYLDAAECPILPCSPPSIECLKQKKKESYDRNITITLVQQQCRRWTKLQRNVYQAFTSTFNQFPTVLLGCCQCWGSTYSLIWSGIGVVGGGGANMEQIKN